MTHDYKRNGTISLFAAMNTADGSVIGTCMNKHRHQEWLRFLNLIKRSTPADKEIHIICDNSNDVTWGDLEDWILSQERSRNSKGSVFTSPIFQKSDPVYEGVKVPVEFYTVIAVVDDANGQLSVTAFQMNQSGVMPPQPGAPQPKAPFDPGRFSVDQVTLPELADVRPRFREAQGF